MKSAWFTKSRSVGGAGLNLELWENSARLSALLICVLTASGVEAPQHCCSFQDGLEALVCPAVQPAFPACFYKCGVQLFMHVM